MKDRLTPCIHYTHPYGDRAKGFHDVTLKTCSHCPKYRPRKTGKRPEPVARKRQKDKDRHDNWKNY